MASSALSESESSTLSDSDWLLSKIFKFEMSFTFLRL